MYVPDEMKINRFQDVNIPENKSFFARYGFNAPSDVSSYTGDDVPPEIGRKSDNLALMDSYDRQRQAEEDAKK